MSTPNVDVLIVVALPLEYDAVKALKGSHARETSWSKERTDLEPRGYPVSFRHVLSRDGHKRLWALTRAERTGKAAATACATALMPVLKPGIVAMSGVCAGRRGDVALGDVIAASYTWQFDLGALNPGRRADGTVDPAAPAVHENDDSGTEVLPPWIDLLNDYQRSGEFPKLPRRRPRPYGPQMDWAILALAETGQIPHDTGWMPDRKAVLERLWNPDAGGWLVPKKLELSVAGKAQAEYLRIVYLPGTPLPRPVASAPVLHVAPIASSDNVIRDETVWGKLKGHMRTVRGAEMEVAAIGARAKAYGRPWFAFKGVMDHAALDKDDRIKEFAALASATYMEDFLRSIRREQFPSWPIDQHGREANLPVAHRTPVFEGRTVESAALIALWNRDWAAWHSAYEKNQPAARRAVPVRSPAIIVVTGWGGVGKTTLAARLRNMIDDGGRDKVDRYFEWSFYTQGRKGGVDSGDLFIDAALRSFGDDASVDGKDPATKGQLLARRVAAGRHLLVIDGLEPLQEAPDASNEAMLRGDGLRALFRTLAAEGGSGLCVVTSRCKVRDLIDWRLTTAPHWELANLSVPDGVKVLRNLEVSGFAEDLAAAVREVRGHALTITLMGLYLKARYGERADIAKRDTFSFQQADDGEQDGHAGRILRAYEELLQGQKRTVELAVMGIISLFDRPVTFEMVRPLFAKRASLTEPLAATPQTLWEEATGRLRRLGLLEAEEQAIGTRHEGEMAAAVHPIIREYFAASNLKNHRSETLQAHEVLYESLRAQVPGAKTLAELSDLYRAVAHGCQAGNYTGAWEIYVSHIRRHNVYYSVNELGAFETDLAALGWFFTERWTTPVESLPSDVKAQLFYDVANCSRAAMRLSDSRQAVRLAILGARGCQPPLPELEVDALRFLSALDLAMGHINESVDSGQRATELASTADVPDYQRLTARVTYAATLVAAGRKDAAQNQFLEAKLQLPKIPAERRSELRLWYEWRLAELRLAEVEDTAWRLSLVASVPAREVPALEAATTFSESYAQNLLTTIRALEGLPRVGPLYTAMGYLAVAHASLYALVMRRLAGAAGSTEFARTIVAFLNTADALLLKGGRRDYKPFKVHAAAWLAHVMGDYERARHLLDEASELTERTNMRTIQGDVLLTSARLFRDRAALEKAKNTIRSAGHVRRFAQLADAEHAAQSWPEA